MKAAPRALPAWSPSAPPVRGSPLFRLGELPNPRSFRGPALQEPASGCRAGLRSSGPPLCPLPSWVPQPGWSSNLLLSVLRPLQSGNAQGAFPGSDGGFLTSHDKDVRDALTVADPCPNSTLRANQFSRTLSLKPSEVPQQAYSGTPKTRRRIDCRGNPPP